MQQPEPEKSRKPLRSLARMPLTFHIYNPIKLHFSYHTVPYLKTKHPMLHPWGHGIDMVPPASPSLNPL